MMPRAWLAVLFVSATMLITPCAAAAVVTLDYGAHDISVTVEPGQDAAYIVLLEAGDVLEVELLVTSGGPVDFYLTNSTAYDVYKASVSGTVNFDSLFYVVDYSRINAESIRYTYDVLIDNELVILIDNTGCTEGGAMPVGPVNVEGTITAQADIWTPQNIAVTIIAGILIAAFMIGVWMPRKGRGSGP